MRIAKLSEVHFRKMLVTRAARATRRSYKRALADGHAVVVSRGGLLYSVSRDGGERVIGKIEGEARTVRVGERRRI